ncbi:ABC transporter permease [Candidatus Peregrinibacteria bacterium]|jgi:ABC-2 type transport system permease protein|nr:ABC transporter permease [Candidatus Peregrinibacteria bacterium]MBT7736388.1 ABC transporter permease [Candidatus Peregrinibacteria bacterium]
MINPRGTWTLFKRETWRYLKVYQQTVLAPVISNILFLAVFGLSIQRTIPNTDLEYLQFLAPGLILMGIINNAYQNPSSSMIIMKYQNLIESLLMLPLRASEKLLAFTASAVSRGLIVGLVTYLTVIFFVDLPYASVGIIVGSAVLISLFFGFLGLIVGIWGDEMDKLAMIQNFVLTPLIFLGGVFYPISALPEAFAKVSQLNPIVYMINLFRYGFTGFQEFPILPSFAIVTGCTVFVGVIAYLMLKRGYKLQS